VYRYISFALSAEGLLVMYDENEANSMETMHMVCIPYEKVSTILKPNLIYAGDHNDFFSYFSAIDDWTKYDFDPSKYDAKSNFTIKYPNDCTLSKLEDDSVKIDIPSDYGTISMLISKEEHSLNKNHWFHIEGYNFKINLESVKNSADIVGVVRGEPYWIEIIFPYSEDDTEKKIMVDKVNKILSTIRFSMVLR
jgi:hypothetical protein